jgi:hypothetical protein
VQNQCCPWDEENHVGEISVAHMPVHAIAADFMFVRCIDIYLLQFGWNTFSSLVENIVRDPNGTLYCVKPHENAIVENSVALGWAFVYDAIWNLEATDLWYYVLKDQPSAA